MDKDKAVLGFTLIELLVVIAIIGILVSLSVISFSLIRTRQQEDIAHELIKIIRMGQDNAIVKGQPYALDYDEDAVYLLVYNAHEMPSEVHSEADAEINKVINESTLLQLGQANEHKTVQADFEENLDTNKQIEFFWEKSPLATSLILSKKFKITFPEAKFTWREDEKKPAKNQTMVLNEQIQQVLDKNQQQKQFRPRMIFWPAGYVEPAGSIQIVDLNTNTLVNLTIDFQGKIEITTDSKAAYSPKAL